MTARKSISKKVRFEVFKRDLFTCQYCGSHPPSVVLECDHINPVASGGGNDLENLITACFDCNRGKGDRELTNVPMSLSKKAEQVLEREAQIRGYQEVLEAKRMRIEQEADSICELYEIFNSGYTLTDRSMITVRRFVDLLGYHQVYWAMETAYTKKIKGKGREFQYFCGICWKMIKGESNE